MSFSPLDYPDAASVATLTGSTSESAFRVILTHTPYGERRHRSEILVWLRPASGVIHEISNEQLVGERRVGVGTATSLDPFDKYCLVRSDPTEEPLTRLFNHLAGPVAYAYGDNRDPLWRRISVNDRVIFYREGPLRLRAVFDAQTRLPHTARTETGVVHWEYLPLRTARIPEAPDVSTWRLEETQVRHVRDQASTFEIGEYLSLEPIDTMLRDRQDPTQERTSIVFRTTSMDRSFLYATWRLSERPTARVRMALDDDESSYDTRQARGDFQLIRELRAGDRSGRIRIHDVDNLEFLGRLSQPLEVAPVVDEPTEQWRSRVASLVTSVAPD